MAPRGFSTVVGTWNTTNNFWNTDATGANLGSLTNTTGSTDDLIIKQATTNTGSITVIGTQNASSITFAANVGPTVNITGGAIVIGGTGASSGIFQQSTGANTISASLTLNSGISAFNFSNSSTGLLTIGAVTGAATSGTQTITVGSSSSGGITLNGIIGNGGYGGKVALTVNSSGAGVTTLSAANTFSGATTVTAGTLALTTNLALQNSALDTTGSGVVTFTGASAPTIGGLNGSVDLATKFTTGYSSVGTLTLNPVSGVTATYSGIIANGTMGLTKSGLGTQILNGSSVNTYTGATTVATGALTLDLTNLTTPTDLINSLSVLNLNGGTLSVKGKNSGNSSQTFASTTLGASGGSTLIVDDNAANNTLLALGAITRSVAGRTLNVTLPAGSQTATNGITTSTATSDGILGPWATVETPTGPRRASTTLLP